MNCPFCKQEMYFNGHVLGDNGECEEYACHSIPCLVNTEYPRYKCQIDEGKKIVGEEYMLGTFYVEVYEDTTLIQRLQSGMLFDQVKIHRPIFLNPTNSDQTLDKLKLLVIFS